MKKSEIRDQFNAASGKYDAQRKLFLPFLHDYYRSGIIYLSSHKFRNVLDLGAGTGLLSQYLYSYFPTARYTLVDISDNMLALAKERFAHLKNFDFVTQDYSKKLPGRGYDLVASALSIHHLTDAEKMKLYKNVYLSLGRSGCFLNIDQYRSADKRVETKFEEIWMNVIKKNFSHVQHADVTAWKKRRKLDKETSIETEIARLKRVGFREVDCVYKYWKFGVVVGRK